MIEGYLLDTNVLGELERHDGDQIVQNWFRPIPIGKLFTTAISIGELRFGIEKLPTGRRRSGLHDWLEELTNRFADRVLPFDQKSALIWGRLRSDLRKIGKEQPTLDLQIAAIALHHGLPLVTRNTKHFEGLGLSLIDPWTYQS